MPRRDSSSPRAAYARRTARVLLIDDADRLLLLRYLLKPDRPELGHIWLTPGGGVEPEEDLAAGAARELLEETGLRAAPDDLRLVAYTTGEADLGYARGLFRDDFFLHRVPTHDVESAGLTEWERKHLLAHHWWTHVELAETTEAIMPFRLAALMRDILAGDIPAEPIQLPWRV